MNPSLEAGAGVRTIKAWLIPPIVVPIAILLAVVIAAVMRSYP